MASQEEPCSLCRGARFVKSAQYPGKNILIRCSCRKAYDQRKGHERVNTLFTKSNIPPRSASWSFASYPESANQQVKETLMRYMQSAMTQQVDKQGIYLFSGGGRCKTGLAISMLHEAVSQEKPALFLSEMELFQIFNDAYKAQQRITRAIYTDADERTNDSYEASKSQKLMVLLKETAWLVLDDIGVASPSPHILSMFYHIVDYRYNAKLYTIFTSNYSLSELLAYWGRDKGAMRVINRFGAYCYEIAVEGPDQRMI